MTPKWDLDKRGLGNQSFLQKSLKNMEKQQQIVEKSYNIYANKTTGAAFGGAPRGRRFAPSPWVVVFAYMLYDFSTIFCCFSMFFNDFCRKDWFPGPLLSRPLLGVTDLCFSARGCRPSRPPPQQSPNNNQPKIGKNSFSKNSLMIFPHVFKQVFKYFCGRFTPA